MVVTVPYALAVMDDKPERDTREAALLALARAGDLDAFTGLVELHERRILGLALRMTGDLADAQDAAQETFIRLHRNLGRIDSERALGPWLYSVAVNACRDIGRSRRRSQLVPADAARRDAPNPEGICSDREMEQQLRAGLRRLPEKERAALLLREMEGLSTAEVADVLGSSEATVRSQICSARLKMRRFFGRGRK